MVSLFVSCIDKKNHNLTQTYNNMDEEVPWTFFNRAQVKLWNHLIKKPVILSSHIVINICCHIVNYLSTLLFTHNTYTFNLFLPIWWLQNSVDKKCLLLTFVCTWITCSYCPGWWRWAQCTGWIWRTRLPGTPSEGTPSSSAPSPPAISTGSASFRSDLTSI